MNKYGVKVGDIFSASWGYDQTNLNFFQVVKICGKESVRVREVSLPRVNSQAIGPMAETNTYRIPEGEILPARSCGSVFIKDQVNGDLKRLRKYGENISFYLSSFTDAYLEKDLEIECYESWTH